MARLSGVVPQQRLLMLSLLVACCFFVSLSMAKRCREAETCGECLEQQHHSCVWEVRYEGAEGFEGSDPLGDCYSKSDLPPTNAKTYSAEEVEKEVKKDWLEYVRGEAETYRFGNIEGLSEPEIKEILRVLAYRMQFEQLTFPKNAKPYLTIPRLDIPDDKWEIKKRQAKLLCKGEIGAASTYALRPAFSCVAEQFHRSYLELSDLWQSPLYLQQLLSKPFRLGEFGSKQELSEHLAILGRTAGITEAKTEDERARMETATSKHWLFIWHACVFGLEYCVQTEEQFPVADIRTRMLGHVASITMGKINRGVCKQKEKSRKGAILKTVRTMAPVKRLRAGPKEPASSKKPKPTSAEKTEASRQRIVMNPALGFNSRNPDVPERREDTDDSSYGDVFLPGANGSEDLDDGPRDSGGDDDEAPLIQSFPR